MTTWNDLILTRRGRVTPLLKIETGTGTFNYAAFAVSEDDTFWEPRLLSLSGGRRAIHPLGDGFSLAEMNISLNNNTASGGGEGHFEALNRSHFFKNATVTVYHGITHDDELYKQQIFTGVLHKPSFTAQRFSFQVVPRFRQNFGLLQRPVSTDSFSNAPDDAIGAYLNIILGFVSGNRGAIKCNMVDNTTNAEVFAFAMGENASVDAVIRKRNNAWSQLTLTTDYTVTLADTDGQGNTFTSITLQSGVYSDGDEIYARGSGLVDASSSLITNPAEALKRAILLFSGLDSADLDDDLWDDAEDECDTRGYPGDYPATYPLLGCLVPKTPGALEGEETSQFDLITRLAAGFNHTPIITREGKLGLVSIDMSQSAGATPVHFSQATATRPGAGDFSGPLTIDDEPLPIVNKVTCFYSPHHQAERLFCRTMEATNSESEDSFGLRESTWENRIFNKNCPTYGTGVDDVLDRRLKAQSGGAQKVSFTVNGWHGLQTGADVGDVVLVSSQRAAGQWTEQAVIITAATPNFSSNTVDLEGYVLGANYWLGSPNFGNLEATFLPTADQWFDEANPGTSQSAGALYHGLFSGNRRRLAIKYDLSSLSGRTIKSAYWRFYLTLDWGAAEAKLCQLSATGFIEAGNWNNIDGSSTTWNDATHIGSQLGDTITLNGASGDFYQINFNSTGISALQSAAGGNVALTFSVDMDDDGGIQIADRSYSPAYQPKLVIIYE
jgi:hypothetical protein